MKNKLVFLKEDSPFKEEWLSEEDHKNYKKEREKLLKNLLRIKDRRKKLKKK